DELNERLLDGQTAPEILPWLNALPAVRDRLAERWPDSREITDGNLSEWRKGGYQDWIADQKIRALVTVVDRMADAAGQAPESLLRKVWTGKTLESLEALLATDEKILLTGADKIAALSAAAL